MNTHNAPMLLDLAIQNIVRDEDLVIPILEWLPEHIFLPLLEVAVTGRHYKTLRAIIGDWPYPYLSLRVLRGVEKPHQDILKALLDGVDDLFLQKIHPKRSKLQVLDLRENTVTNAWYGGSGSMAGSSACSVKELVDAHHRRKRQKVGESMLEERQLFDPLVVLIDGLIENGGPDESLTYLIERVQQREDILHLCCSRLELVNVPRNFFLIEKMMETLQLDFIEELVMKSTWEVDILGSFAPYLGQMVNLRKLTLSRAIMHFWLPQDDEQEAENLFVQFTSQFAQLQQLKELTVEYVHCLHGRWEQVLKYLKNPLEFLCITSLPLLTSDSNYLSMCPSTSHLKSLHLKDIIQTTLDPELLHVLLMRSSATLQDLDLSGCRFSNNFFFSILPVLGQCSQLQSFSFYGNSLSMADLGTLLRRILLLHKLTFLELPVPFDCYLDNTDSPHQRTLQLHMDKLRDIVLESGRQPKEMASHRDSDREHDSIAVRL
ncbi:melanoma antigen preferentially expressed in tumors-like [Echinops telfairi]|uniref:Melanoma antigen preferentially expressed in tumors-like n=1 Tax=Echinops telfairi TaxID=9371 RepID=A0AC55CJD1_ECHTE|nr:melanoma antigen preferentially expressed in tumors-like [Echinops telfairi]